MVPAFDGEAVAPPLRLSNQVEAEQSRVDRESEADVRNVERSPVRKRKRNNPQEPEESIHPEGRTRQEDNVVSERPPPNPSKGKNPETRAKRQKELEAMRRNMKNWFSIQAEGSIKKKSSELEASAGRASPKK